MGSKSGRLLETGSFSDFVIVSRGVEIKVHRACLAGASPFFDAVMKGGFSESIDQRLKLEESPAAIFVVIWYIYTGTYPPFKHSKLDWNNKLESTFRKAATPDMPVFSSHLFLPHMEVMKLADMMMLPKLQNIACDEVRCQILKFPYEYPNPAKVDDATFDSWASHPNFQQALDVAYTCDDSCLGNLKLFFTWACVYNAWKWPSGTKDFKDLVMKHPGFGWALYIERDQWGPQNIPNCSCCQVAMAPHLDSLIYENNGSITQMTCKCRYRGFCMEGCKVADQTVVRRVPAYCTKCLSYSRKLSLNYLTRSEEGLEIVADGSFCKCGPRGVFHRFLTNTA